MQEAEFLKESGSLQVLAWSRKSCMGHSEFSRRILSPFVLSEHAGRYLSCPLCWGGLCHCFPDWAVPRSYSEVDKSSDEEHCLSGSYSLAFNPDVQLYEMPFFKQGHLLLHSIFCFS